MKRLTEKLATMEPVDINIAAIEYLNLMLERCTVHLLASLTGLSRPMFYRWMDSDRAYDQMDHVRSAWFILMCENHPKLQLLMKRAPMTYPRLAKRVIDGE